MSFQVLNLSKSYNRFNPFKKCEVLEDVSFNINKGELYSIIGQNGVGKTTTIKCILKFIKKDRGEISFEGKDMSEIIEKGKLGYLPEELVYPSSISAMSYITDMGILKGMDKELIKKKISELACLFELDKCIDKPIKKLSKGMRKKVGFIQAVLNEPEFLILDEPTDGLDPVARRIMLDYIKSLRQSGCSILVTSHILADLEMVCTRVGIMDRGCIINEVDLEKLRKEKCKTSIKVLVKNEDDFKEKVYILEKEKPLIFKNIEELKILNIDYSNQTLEDIYFNTLKKGKD